MFEYFVDDAWPYAGPDQLAIRTDRYKLVDNFLENDIDELYDLINDPGEMNNLIDDENYEQVEKGLRKESKRLQKKYKYNPDRDWWLRTQIKWLWKNIFYFTIWAKNVMVIVDYND